MKIKKFLNKIASYNLPVAVIALWVSPRYLYKKLINENPQGTYQGMTFSKFEKTRSSY